eukprot:g63092.t1
MFVLFVLFLVAAFAVACVVSLAMWPDVLVFPFCVAFFHIAGNYIFLLHHSFCFRGIPKLTCRPGVVPGRMNLASAGRGLRQSHLAYEFSLTNSYTAPNSSDRFALARLEWRPGMGLGLFSPLSEGFVY